jgi:predicted DsbA family dithiol-disulfide isomerase
MPAALKIDFVSDVSCPWCAIGLAALEQALARLSDGAAAEIHFQPFELNPQMPPEGQDLTEHLVGKYGISGAQAESNGRRSGRVANRSGSRSAWTSAAGSTTPSMPTACCTGPSLKDGKAP